MKVLMDSTKKVNDCIVLKCSSIRGDTGGSCPIAVRSSASLLGVRVG